MKFKKIDTTAHELKQYTFRINEKEIEAILIAIDIARGSTLRAPTTSLMSELRRKVNNVNKELRRALKEQ